MDIFSCHGRVYQVRTSENDFYELKSLVTKAVDRTRRAVKDAEAKRGPGTRTSADLDRIGLLWVLDRLSEALNEADLREGAGNPTAAAERFQRFLDSCYDIAVSTDASATAMAREAAHYAALSEDRARDRKAQEAAKRSAEQDKYFASHAFPDDYARAALIDRLAAALRTDPAVGVRESYELAMRATQ